MSAYSTKDLSRTQAEELLLKVYLKEISKNFNLNRLSDTEIENKLNDFAYSEEHDDILGVLYNFNIICKP